MEDQIQFIIPESETCLLASLLGWTAGGPALLESLDRSKGDKIAGLCILKGLGLFGLVTRQHP